MQEKNLKRAEEVCNLLESYRIEIRNIKNLIKIGSASIEITTTIVSNDGNARVANRDISLMALGKDILKFILHQKRLYLQSRILELESELRTL